MKTQKAVNRIINSVWTIEYRQVSETSVELVRYSRDDEEGYTNEDKLPIGRVIEDDRRTVTGVEIGGTKSCNVRVTKGTEYKVVNPKHVFDYKG